MSTIVFGLLGAGGFAREVMPFVRSSVARSLGANESDVSCYFVETWEPKSDHLNGYPLISLESFMTLEGSRYFNVAVGSGTDRAEMVRAVGDAAKPLTLIAPHSISLDCNQIGEGAVFCSNTMVTSNAVVGKFFQCNIYSYVAHDCVIGDYVTLAPGVRCNGRVHVGDFAYLGTNAVIREGGGDKPLRIGRGAVVGMGAVVTKDVPEGAVVVGNPARLFVK